MEYTTFRIGNKYKDIELDYYEGPKNVGSGEVVGMIIKLDRPIIIDVHYRRNLVKLGDFDSDSIVPTHDIIGFKTMMGIKYNKRRTTC